jgi:hypothetical protein
LGIRGARRKEASGRKGLAVKTELEIRTASAVSSGVTDAPAMVAANASSLTKPRCLSFPERRP